MNETTAATRRVIEGDRHHYLLDGQRVDSVSWILRQGLAKPALVGWAARQVAEFAVDRLELLQQLQRDEAIDLLRGAADRDRERAAVRGIDLHLIAERLARREEVQVSGEQAALAAAYARFLREWRVEAELIERAVFSRAHQYAGTFDLVAHIPALGRVLLDVKTNRSGPFPEVALQMAAYGRAEFYLLTDREVAMPSLDAHAVLWVRPDGYDLYPIDVGEDEWQAFLAAARVTRWLGERSRQVRGEALAPPTPGEASRV
jgi:hypothetical protein